MNAENARRGLLSWADTFLPEAPISEGGDTSDHVRRVRLAVAQSALGALATAGVAALYAWLGSPWSAAAIGCVTLTLLASPPLLQRGRSVSFIGNTTIAAAFIATLVVSLRSGGPASPAVVWNFLLPLAVYSVCGRASAVVWTLLAAAQIAGLALAERSGATFAQDFSGPALTVLRMVADAGVLVATVALLLVVDATRAAAVEAQQAAELALDRQRILEDMHDGVGSHLLGLLVQSRAGALRPEDLTHSLESCLDELRLIVDSLDPHHASLPAALGALRGRVVARCEGQGVALRWVVEEARLTRFTPADGLQVLRALQEMLNNTLRHAQASLVDVHIGAPRQDHVEQTDSARHDDALPAAVPSSDALEISVSDDGVGLSAPQGEGVPSRGVSPGRGMKSLHARARKLGGVFTLHELPRGLRAAIQLGPTSVQVTATPPSSRDGWGSSTEPR